MSTQDFDEENGERRQESVRNKEKVWLHVR
jgi:hypothetical protein